MAAVPKPEILHFDGTAGPIEVVPLANHEHIVDALREDLEREVAQLAVIAHLLRARPNETEITAAWRVRRELDYYHQERLVDDVIHDHLDPKLEALQREAERDRG